LIDRVWLNPIHGWQEITSTYVSRDPVASKPQRLNGRRLGNHFHSNYTGVPHTESNVDT
jgi:hypothetical protein